jgi:hypothetical protein
MSDKKAVIVIDLQKDYLLEVINSRHINYQESDDEY